MRTSWILGVVLAAGLLGAAIGYQLNTVAQASILGDFWRVQCASDFCVAVHENGDTYVVLPTIERTQSGFTAKSPPVYMGRLTTR